MNAVSRNVSANSLLPKALPKNLLAGEPIQMESSTRCCGVYTDALQQFQTKLQDLTEHARAGTLTDLQDFESGRDALRLSGLPEVKRRFVERQLDLAMDYAISSLSTSSRLFGAALFHLRQIQSRIKSWLASANCCGACQQSTPALDRPDQSIASRIG